MTRRGVVVLVGAASLALSACAVEHRYAQKPQPAPVVMPRVFVDPAADYVAHIRELLGKGAFEELDATAEDLLRTRERFPGGEWKLFRFHRALERPTGSAGGIRDGAINPNDTIDMWERHIAHLREWHRRRPESAAGTIGLGNALSRYAWQARGDGPGSGVTEEGRRLFKERLAEASRVLLEGARTATKDPQWFSVMIDIARGQGHDRVEVDELFNRGAAAEPLYAAVYVAKARYLLPQWYGEPGEWTRFVESSADRVGGAAGSALYADVVWQVSRSGGGGGRTFFDSGVSWPRLQASFINQRDTYRWSDRDMNVFGFIAGLAGDRRVARDVLDRIGNAWDPDLWQNEANFSRFLQWATGSD